MEPGGALQTGLGPRPAGQATVAQVLARCGGHHADRPDGGQTPGHLERRPARGAVHHHDPGRGQEHRFVTRNDLSVYQGISFLNGKQYAHWLVTNVPGSGNTLEGTEMMR